MIYRADEMVINHLLTTRMSYNQQENHESPRDRSNFILIDYFDWLQYLSRIDNEKMVTKSLYNFRTIYADCYNLINLLQNKLNSDNLSMILQENKKRINENVEKTTIEYLCQGYSLFVEEVLSLQIYLLNSYKYNNSTLPILLIPFSFGLNRLSTSHINLKETYDDNNMLRVDVQNGHLVDACVRSKIDFGIRTYSYNKISSDFPYNLPYTWQVSKTSFDRLSRIIGEKMPPIAECYSQYCYTGFVTKEDEIRYGVNQPITSSEIQGKKLYSNVYIMNYPFLLPNMRLKRNIVDGKDTNFASFIKD